MNLKKQEIINRAEKELVKFGIIEVNKVIEDWVKSLTMENETHVKFADDIINLLSNYQSQPNWVLLIQICGALNVKFKDIALPFNASVDKTEAIVATLAKANPLLLFALGKLTLVTSGIDLCGLVAFMACNKANENFMSEFGLMHTIAIYLVSLKRKKNVQLHDHLLLRSHELAFVLVSRIKRPKLQVADIKKCQYAIQDCFNDNNKEQFVTEFILKSHLPRKNLISILSEKTMTLEHTMQLFLKKPVYYMTLNEAMFPMFDLSALSMMDGINPQKLNIATLNILASFRKNCFNEMLTTLSVIRQQGYGIRDISEQDEYSIHFKNLLVTAQKYYGDPFFKKICLIYSAEAQPKINNLKPDNMSEKVFQGLMLLFGKIPLFVLLDAAEKDVTENIFSTLGMLMSFLLEKHNAEEINHIQNFTVKQLQSMQTWSELEKWLSNCQERLVTEVDKTAPTTNGL
jgi:hypothetical protein